MSTKKREQHHAGHASHPAKSGGTSEKTAPVRHEVSDGERSQSIQVLAYTLWEQAGKPDGGTDQERFWCEAEKEFTADRAG